MISKEMIKMMVAAGVRERRPSFAKETGVVEGGDMVDEFQGV
jgi:hypothetical protein